MSVTLPPDYVGALVQYLKAQVPPAASALSAPIVIDPAAISAVLDPDKVKLGDFAISVAASGGFPAEWDARLARPRCDLTCYGPYGYEAMRLYRLVRAILEPTDGILGFTAANARVVDVTFETSQPIAGVDPNGWRFVFSAVSMYAGMVPV